jgi:hypothetical protein
MTYYTKVNRKWKPRQTVIFVHKMDEGDSLIGFGIIETARQFSDLSEKEKAICAEYGWKTALDFTFMKEFTAPLLVRETFLAKTSRRGKYLHPFDLSKVQMRELLSQAGEYQGFTRIMRRI